MALAAPSPEWAYRVVNSAARSLRRDLKKQGKFGADAGAPGAGLISRLPRSRQTRPQGRAARQTPQNRRRLFQTEFTTHSHGDCQPPARQYNITSHPQKL